MIDTFANALDDAAERHADKTALAIGDKRLTFRTLAEESKKIACGWLDAGIEPGDRVGLWLESNVSWALNFWAFARIGAVIVPLSPRWTAVELRDVLEHAKLRGLLIGERFRRFDFLNLLKEAAGARGISSYVPLIVSTASIAPPGLLSLATFQSAVPDAALLRRINQLQAAQRGEDVAVIQFTSGSTAFAKGAMLRQRAMLEYVRDYGVRLNMAPEDRVLCQMPFFHIAGLNHVLLVPVVQGATVFTAESFDPALALKQLEGEACTVVGGISTMYLRMIDEARSAPASFASIEKAWIQGSSTVSASVQRLTGIKGLTGHYGATEVSGATTFGDVRDPLNVRLSNVGRELPGIETRIVDLETGAVLPPGGSGEIWHRSARMMAGYFGLPRDQWNIDDDGWFHTGDIGSFDQQGYLSFQGRKKEMLKTGGENVSCPEVEDVLLSHSAVRLAAVIGIPDERLEEVPIAFVELRSEQNGTPEALIEHCARSLAKFKVPRRIFILSALPMTPSNKIHKPALRDLAMESLAFGSKVLRPEGTQQ